MTTTTAQDFAVTIYLNQTTTAQAAARGEAGPAALVAADPAYGAGLAIFTRIRGAATLPGDTLTAVGPFTVTAPDAQYAAEAAFALGNGAAADSADYYANRVRSVSVGDVATGTPLKISVAYLK